MEEVFKYRFDRRTIYWTIVYLILLLVLGWLLYHLYEGGYLSAWFTSFIAALIALLTLSIPRKIAVSPDNVEIRPGTTATKWIVPLFGGFGFFGYYGHFLDLRGFERIRLYASEWNHFVEITDIYEERLYVSCRDADRLVAALTPPENAVRK